MNSVPPGPYALPHSGAVCYTVAGITQGRSKAMASNGKKRKTAKVWITRGICLALALLMLGMVLASALWSNVW